MVDNRFRTPGQFLEHLLEAADLPQRVLALMLDIHESQVSKLVTGRKPFTAKIALLLEEVFDVPAGAISGTSEAVRFEPCPHRAAACRKH